MSASRMLAASASIFAMAATVFAAPAMAQNQEEDAAPSQLESASFQDDGAIVVTGTRIRNTPQYTQPNPVISIGRDDVQSAGVTNLTDFLAENPALSGSTTANDTSGTNAGIGQVGLNLLNLRNLGTQRTLVLVDGRRHVASTPGSASIDINTIPIELIERVDIVTGAAAIYGADAVTGVVNFVLRRNFEGLSIRGQSGISQRGDAANQLLALTAGTNFGGGRGNVAVSLEYSRESALGRGTRRFLTQNGLCGFYRNQADFPDDPNVPDLVPECDVRYFDSNAVSAIDVDLDTVPDYFGEGQVWDEGRFIGDIFQVGGSGTPVSTYSGDVLPQVERYAANLLFNYDITDSVNFYAQAKYVRIVSETENQPSFDFFLVIPSDNAFISPTLRQAIDDVGVPAFGLLITGRDNFDLGRRGETATRQTYRGVVGVRADLAENLRFDVSYVYGRTDNRTFQTNYRFNDRFYAAIDAIEVNGQIVCRSNVQPVGNSNQQFNFDFNDPGTALGLSFTPGANSGCVPFNPFVDNAAAGNQAAINWITTSANDRSRLEQHVATAVLDGNLGNARLWGGPIGFALGAEYRKESSSNQPDPIGINYPVFGNQLFPTVGSFDVKEVFGELQIPIVSDRPFFNDLIVNGAVRYSDYSTVGSTFTWQVGAIWAPVRDIRFRGTYTQAVRAPNIAELFGPQSQSFGSFADPCSPSRINDGTDSRPGNCAAILSELGLTPAQQAAFTGALSATVPGLVSGNPNLQEETSKTLTAGVVLQPRFIPGLTLSADYYDVRIGDAVSTPSGQILANLCVDQPRPNPFCDAIDRRPGGDPLAPGVISGFRTLPQNVAEFRTSGIDFAANYRVRTDSIGTFDFRLRGNRLLRYERLPVIGGVVVNERNTVDIPNWTVNFNTTWSLDNVALTWRVNYFSPTLRYSRQTFAAQPDYVEERYAKFDARFTHDVQMNFMASDRFNFYLGVNNLFNQEPDIGASFYPVSAVGRYFYGGVRVSLDRLPL